MPVLTQKLMIDEMLRPTVRVVSSKHNGSGLIVYSEDGLTLVLTNAHIIEEDVNDEENLEDTPFIHVDRYNYDENGKLIGFYRRQSEIVAYDYGNDLAILRMRDKEPERYVAHLPTPEFIKNITVFDEVFVVGCSLGHFPVPSKGILSSMNAELQNREFWMSSAPLVMGNSGGGCFKWDAKLKKYMLVGVPTALAYIRKGESETSEGTDDIKDIIPHLNYVIPPYRISSFVAFVVDKLKNMKADLESDR